MADRRAWTAAALISVVATPAQAQTPPRPLVESLMDRASAVGDAVDRALTAFIAFLPRSLEGFSAPLAAIWSAPSPGRTLLITLLIIALMGGTAVLMLTLLRGLRRRAGRDPVAVRGAFLMLACDLASASAGILVGRIGMARFLEGVSADLVLAQAIVGATMRCLVVGVLIRFLLRPDCARFRLVALPDREAYEIALSILALVVFGTFVLNSVTALQAFGLPLPTAQLVLFVVAAVMMTSALALASRPVPGVPAWLRRLAKVLIMLVAVLWLGAVLIQDFSLYLGLVRSLGAVLVAVTIDRLFVISIKGAHRAATLRRLGVFRVIAAAVAVAVVARILAELWLYGTFHVISDAAWPAFSRALTSASIVLIVGLAIVMAINAHIEAELERARSGHAGEAHASRATTLLPGVKLLGAIAIMTIVSLVALSELGVDIAPLIAGAGIFGLAISFGSQALVRDIVAGIFFMVDDTFRLGEHVEAAGHAGVVTRITLRTVSLRDREGRLHTIPLGSIGALSNHSRGLAKLDLEITLYGEEAQVQITAIGKRLAPLLGEDGVLGGLLKPGSLEVRREDNEASAVYELSGTLPAGAYPRAEELLMREARAAFASLGLKPSAETLSLRRSDAGPDRATRSAV